MSYNIDMDLITKYIDRNRDVSYETFVKIFGFSKGELFQMVYGNHTVVYFTGYYGIHNSNNDFVYYEYNSGNWEKLFYNENAELIFAIDSNSCWEEWITDDEVTIYRDSFGESIIVDKFGDLN